MRTRRLSRTLARLRVKLSIALVQWYQHVRRRRPRRRPANELVQLFSRLADSRDTPGSTGWEGSAYVKRVDNRARVTSAAATLAVRKFSGACQRTATNADNATM
jgi:hypothetical protein